MSACTPVPQADVPANLSAAFAELSTQPPELQIARSIVMRDCLVGAGYDLPFIASWPTIPGDTYVGLGGVLASEDVATSFGYSSTLKDEPDVFGTYAATLTESERTEFLLEQYGDQQGDVETYDAGGIILTKPTTGCNAEADVALFGSVRESLAVDGFANEVLTEALAFGSAREDLVSSLMPAYTDCMAEEGYELEGLKARYLALDLFGQYRSVGDPPSAEEQRLASADFACQSEVDLRTMLQALFETHAGDWLVTNETRILGLKESVENAVDKANAIING